MTSPAKPITRGDLEAKFRQLAGGLDDRVEDARPRLMTGAVAAVVLVVAVAYLMGRRGGRRRSDIVEIRRI